MSLWNYYRRTAHTITKQALTGINNRAAFEAAREKLYRDFIVSVGLQDVPDFHPTDFQDGGTITGKGYTMQRIGYQMLPDCWASANLYRPDPAPGKHLLPTVLYVCGHSAIGTHAGQKHGISWARRGYACMVLDTIAQNDNPGYHHGLRVGQNYEWISMGYGSAGSKSDQIPVQFDLDLDLGDG